MNYNSDSPHEEEAIRETCKHAICSECQTPITKPISVPRKTFLERFLFFCYSIIPGAAHMHLGLFRRGLQIMIITFGGLSLASFIGLDSLIPVVLIPTWFFSFFESHYLRRQKDQGFTLRDQDLFDRQLFDYTPLLKNRRIIGSVIVFIGILSLLHQIDRSNILDRLFGYQYYLVRGSFIPILLILGGVYMILKAKQSPKRMPEVSE